MKLAVILSISLFFACSAANAETRITKVGILDQGDYSTGQEGGLQIDLSRNVCSTEDTDSDGIITEDEKVYEPFFDTVVALEVTNEGSANIHFSRAWVKVAQYDGTKSSFTSKKLALISASEVIAGEKAEMLAFMLKAEVDSKYMQGNRSRGTIGSGFKTVNFFLSGRDDSGRSVTLKARYTLSFSDFDRCG